jgi:hypothetical protein
MGFKDGRMGSLGDRSLSWMRGVGVFFVAWFVLACSSEIPGEHTGIQRQSTSLGTTTFNLTLPPGATASDLVLSAQGGSLLIRDGVKLVADADRYAGVANMSSTTGSVTDFGVGSETGDVISRPSVRLRAGAVAHGAVRSGGGVTLEADARVEGSITRNSVFATPSQLTFSVTFPTSDQGSVTVANDSQRELSAGAYRDVIVRARGKLTLGSGIYFFSSLLIEPNGELRLRNDDTVVVYVKTSLVHRGLISEDAADRANVLFAVAGTAATLVEAPFRGTLLAPQSNIVLSSTTSGHQGAFFGRSVEAQPWTTIRHRPFARFDCLGSATGCPATACDGAGQCLMQYALPEAVTPFRAALVGSERVSIGSRVVLRGAPHAPPPLIVSGGTTRVGEGAIVGSIRSKGAVALAAGVRTTGYLATGADATGKTGADILGQVLEGYPMPLETTAWPVQFHSSQTDVTVLQGQTRDLGAGAYRKVVVRAGGRLRFARGRFDIDQLEIEPAAIVTTDDAGQTRLILRRRLRYDSPILPNGIQKAARLVIEYFGRDRVELRAPFFGQLLSAAGPVSVSLPRATSQVTGTIAAPIVDLAAGGQTVFLQSSVDSGVNLEGQAPTLDSSWEHPVEVATDNPPFNGAFAALDATHGTASGAYSENWEWSHIASFDLSEWADFSPLTQLFEYPANAYPVSPGGTGPGALLWQRRGGSIWHDATFSASAAFAGGVIESSPRTLWLKLDVNTLVYPVLLVAWYNPGVSGSKALAEQRALDLWANFDFAPGVQDLQLSGTFASPARLSGASVAPPDDIWAQCGIQFQVAGAVALPRPAGSSPNCRKNDRSFVADRQQLFDAIRAAAGDDLYNRWFPALSPAIVQVGELVCSEFYAQWLVGTSEIELVLPWDQNQATNIAHELGHLLISPQHVGNSGSGNLMASGSANGDRALTANQCDIARQNAKPRSRAYRAYLRAQGHAPLPTPDSLPPEPPDGMRYPPVMTVSRLRELDPPRCCVIDGEVTEKSSLLCYFLGGSLGGTECNVCCAVSDPAFRDPSASTFLIQTINRTACEASRRLASTDCDRVCCDYGSDFGVKKSISRYQCGADNPEAGYFPGEVIPPGTERWEQVCKQSPE